MSYPSQYAQLGVELAQAELIPADRDLTAEEIELLAGLDARLRTAWRTDKSKEHRGLLKRMDAIRRARKKRDAPAPAPEQQPTAVSLVTNARGVDRPDSRLGDLHRELSELAAKQAGNQQLAGKSLRRLQAIVNGTAPLAARDPGYRKVYERALRIQKKALRPPRAKGPTGKPRRLVRSPGLSYGGREVLGGLPGTRRGH